MLVAVATTFVRLARSKIVSGSHRFARRLDCASAVCSCAKPRDPCDQRVQPHPAVVLFAISSAMTVSICANRAEEIETDSGLANGSWANADCEQRRKR